MPDTISSGGVFCLFIAGEYDYVLTAEKEETPGASARSAWKNRETLSLPGAFAAFGSSIVGKSFIKLAKNMEPRGSFGNLAEHKSAMPDLELKARHNRIDSDARTLPQAIKPKLLNQLNQGRRGGRCWLINTHDFDTPGVWIECKTTEQAQSFEHFSMHGQALVARMRDSSDCGETAAWDSHSGWGL